MLDEVEHDAVNVRAQRGVVMVVVDSRARFEAGEEKMGAVVRAGSRPIKEPTQARNSVLTAFTE